MNGIPFFSPVVVSRRTQVLCLVHHVHDRQFAAFLPRWLAVLGCFVEGPVARLLYRRCVTITVSESSLPCSAYQPSAYSRRSGTRHLKNV